MSAYQAAADTVSTSIIPIGTRLNRCPETRTRVDSIGCLPQLLHTEGGPEIPMPSNGDSRVPDHTLLSGAEKSPRT